MDLRHLEAPSASWTSKAKTNGNNSQKTFEHELLRMCRNERPKVSDLQWVVRCREAVFWFTAKTENSGASHSRRA